MNAARKIRLSIGVKISSLLAILLLSSIASLVWLSTRLFVQDNTALIQQLNSDAASGHANQIREYLGGVATKVQLFGNILIQHALDRDTKEAFLKGAFATDGEIYGVWLHKMRADGAELQDRAAAPALTNFGDRDGEEALKSFTPDRLAQLGKGESFVIPVRMPNGALLLGIGVPFMKAQDTSEYSHTLVAVLDGARLREAFSNDDVVTSYLVDGKGTVIAHPDTTLAESQVNLSQIAIVGDLISGKFNNGQRSYLDPTDNQEKLGAFKQVGFAGLGIVSDVLASKAFAAAERVQFQSVLLAAIILCISLLAGYVYSDTISWPITLLSKAAVQISQGNFKVRLKPRSRDEVGYLSETFNEMAVGLEERDRVKETFNKFHSKKIAEKILSGEVKLGGERMEATIFFSDIRGFTSFSEAMEPDAVVEMLNEYMTAMVAIIRKHGGEVDKYVGDAIMALWGVPLSTDPKQDSINAVQACLEMRQELEKLNEKRIARGQEVIKIGMGLNRGIVTAGNMGSNEKMEYTVIGDTVNLASRIESITKTAGTDLLVSGSIKEIVKEKFLLEPCGAIKVKGKALAVEVFKVPGYVNEKGEAVLVQTPYSSYEAEASDKVEKKAA